MSVGIANRLRCAFLMALALVTGGCGGSGSGVGNSGGGNISRDVTLNYHLIGVSGLLVNRVQASATPQQVQIQVGSSVRTIRNVFVGVDVADGAFATILLEGSTLLNTSIASQEATIGGTNTSVPLSANGVLQASILGAATTPNQAVIKTSAAIWEGVSLPNGLNISLEAKSSGDMDINVNTTLAINSNQFKSGKSAVSVTAPSVSQTVLAFSGTGGYLTLDGTQAIAGTTNYTAPWSDNGFVSSYTNASITATFN